MILKATHTKPLTEIRRHTAEVFEELRATLEPVIVTEHGRSVGVILDAGTYDLMTERLRVLEEIAMGEMEISAGEHVGWEDVKAGLRKWQR
jgi:prevent-host-death family protein